MIWCNYYIHGRGAKSCSIQGRGDQAKFLGSRAPLSSIKKYGVIVQIFFVVFVIGKIVNRKEYDHDTEAQDKISVDVTRTKNVLKLHTHTKIV